MSTVQRTPNLGLGIRMQRLPGGTAAAPAPATAAGGAKVALLVEPVELIDTPNAVWRQHIRYLVEEDWRLIDCQVNIIPMKGLS